MGFDGIFTSGGSNKRTLMIGVKNCLEQDKISFNLTNSDLIERIFNYYMEEENFRKICIIEKFEEFMELYLRVGKSDYNFPNFESKGNLKRIMEERFEELYSKLEIKDKENNMKFIQFVLFEYYKLSSVFREKILFDATIKKVKDSMKKRSIKNNKKIEIYYKDKKRIINPLFLSESFEFNYLVAYDEKKEIFKNYRICYIEKIVEKEEKIFYSESLKEDIKDIKNDFDAYLTRLNNEIIKVKFLSDDVIKKFKATHHNRPQFKRKSQNPDNIAKEKWYEFHCEDVQARLYFYDFSDEIEIEGKEELKKSFIERAEKAIKNMKKN